VPRTRTPLALLSLLLVACDSAESLRGSLFPSNEIVTVVTKEAITLSATPTVLAAKDGLKAFGDINLICFALRDGVSVEDTNNAYREAIRDTRIEVAIFLDNGSRLKLRPPMQAWALSGRVLGERELSACASVHCRMPAGSAVYKVEATSEPSLATRGVFWNSMKYPDPKSAPAIVPCPLAS
jgi:hypothetical protein